MPGASLADWPVEYEEMEPWYQRAEWDGFKTELAGSMDAFARLEEAAGTQGRLYVHDA